MFAAWWLVFAVLTWSFRCCVWHRLFVWLWLYASLLFGCVDLERTIIRYNNQPSKSSNGKANGLPYASTKALLRVVLLSEGRTRKWKATLKPTTINKQVTANDKQQTTNKQETPLKQSRTEYVSLIHCLQPNDEFMAVDSSNTQQPTRPTMNQPQQLPVTTTIRTNNNQQQPTTNNNNP